MAGHRAALLLMLAAGEGGVMVAASDDGKPGLGQALAANAVTAFIAALIGYALTFPLDYITQTSAYRERRNSQFPPLLIVKLLPRVVPRMVSESGLLFFSRRVMLFAPRLVIKLAVYGAFRGTGPVGGGKVIVAALLSGVATVLYAYPLQRSGADEDHARSYSDVMFQVWKKIDRSGILSLYRGVTGAFAYTIVYNILLFLIMETVAKSVKEDPKLNMLVAAPCAVVFSAVLASPIDLLRKIIVSNPLDYNALLFGGGSAFNEDGRLQLDPDFIVLVDYTKSVLRSWIKRGYIGDIRLSANTIGISFALALHHGFLAKE